MNNVSSQNFNRRNFLQIIAGTAVSGGLLATVATEGRTQCNVRKLWQEPSSEELEKMNNSVMAQYIQEMLDSDHSCAESILGASLKFLGKPANLIDAAAGFGGGMGHYDLCGLLTGGYMAIGFASAMVKENNPELEDYKNQTLKAYWDWWTERSPRHCHELRPKITGYGAEDRYTRMCVRVAAKMEELLQPAV